MLKVLVIFEDPEYEEKVHNYFNEHKVHFLPCQRKYSSFLRMVQYAPHVILLQSSGDFSEQLNLMQLMKKSKVADYIPIVVIGPHISPQEREVILTKGAEEYLYESVALEKLVSVSMNLAKKAFAQQRKDLGIYKNQLEREKEQLLLDSAVTIDEKLDIIEEHIDKLVAFPSTALEVLKDETDPLSSASTLSRIIQTDAAIATELIKLANSAFYSSAGRGISTLRDALVRIGTEQTKSIVMSMSLLGSMKNVYYETGFSFNEFWLHSVTVAVVAEILAKRSNRCNPEEAFFLGLVHEMGVLLYNEYLNDFFLLCLDKSTEMGFPFTFFQKTILHISHNDLMVRLCRRWLFPYKFEEAFEVLDENVFTKEATDRSPLAMITMIADTIAHSMNSGRAADKCIWEIPVPVIRDMGCECIFESDFISKVCDTLAMYSSSLAFDSSTFTQTPSLMNGNGDVTVVCMNNPVRMWSPVENYLKWEGYKVKSVDTKEMLLYELQENKGAIFLILTYLEDDYILLNELIDGKYHGLIFDDTYLLKNDFEERGIIISAYPVDLRNIDMVLHFLHMGRWGDVTQHIGRLGTLLPMQKSKVSSLLVHSLKAFQDLFKDTIKDLVDSVDVATDGEKAIRKARENDGDIDWFFIHHGLTVIESFDVVVEIKRLCHHKRGKFVLLYDGKKPTNLEMTKYAHIGVRRFIDISDKENLHVALCNCMGLNVNRTKQNI